MHLHLRLPIVVAPMDEVFSLILRGCERASELQENLPSMADQPHLLLNSCEDVIAAFKHAVDRLNSWNASALSAHMFLGELPAASGSGMYLGTEREEEGSLGGGYMKPMDLLHAWTMAEEIPFYVNASPPESQIGPPELGLEIPAAARVIEFGDGSGGCSVGTADVEGLVRGRGELPAAADSARRPVGLPVQRPTKKRKESSGNRTERVPALSTGNLEIPPDDGFTWRKYGQKDILNSRFPRSYYRCTHKNYYGCQAKKQVQRLDDDPYTYEVTYCGNHSCQTSTTPLIIPIITKNSTAPPPPPSVAAAAAAAAAERETMTSEATTLTNSFSMSMQLGNYWFSRGLDSGRKDEKSQMINSHGGESSSAPANTSQVRNERDAAECSVADQAEIMFNSRNDGSSMDAIFSSKHEN